MKESRFSLCSVIKRLFTLRHVCPVGVLATLIGLAAAGVAWADDNATTNTPAAKVSAQRSSAVPDSKPAKTERKMSGVELYAIHCNRCHPERYPVEFNEMQWKTLMLHMRVRANLPADQARAILKYLQEEAGN